jgi:hypothetical protein
MNQVRTVAIIDEVIEGVAIAVVGEFVVGSWELLKALKRDRVEVTAEFGVFRENHASTRNEGVDQRFLVLSHLLLHRSSIEQRFLVMVVMMMQLAIFSPTFFFLSFLYSYFLERERERGNLERESVRKKKGFTTVYKVVILTKPRLVRIPIQESQFLID